MKTIENTCMFCMSPLPVSGGSCPRCGRNNAQITNSAHQLRAGSVLAGVYLVGAVLGQGGFGITYVGWDLNSNQKVAIKEYYPEGCVTRELTQHATVLALTGDKGDFFKRGQQKFIDEARVLARFTGDPCIVGVRSYFQDNGTSYIVMDFAEGRTLKQYAAACGGRIDGQDALALLAPLVRSLARVHDAGLLHRDIAPDNIMLQPDGTVKLLDFGAARAISVEGEHSNTINVKHGFAPEEQYRTHGEQGPWTDVYALCATIYQLTTGKVPPQALDRILSGDSLVPPTRYGVNFTPAQEAALIRGLAVKAQDRTPNMRALDAELFYAPGPAVYAQQPASFSQQAYGPSSPDTPHSAAGTGRQSAGGAEQKRKRRRGAIIGAAAAAFVLIGLVIVALIAGSGRQATAAQASSRTPEPVGEETLTAAQSAPAESSAPTATPAPAATQAPLVSPAPKPDIDDTLVFGDFRINVFGEECEINEYLGGNTVVEIPQTVSHYTVVGLGYEAFYGNSALTRVILPEGVRYLDDYALQDCASLVEINLPESLESIGYFCFSGCAGLGALSIPAGVSYISPSAFDECESLTLTVSPESRYYAVENNVLFSFDRKLLHSYIPGNADRAYTVPDSVETIGEGAFCDADKLSAVTIPDSVTVIGEQAFYGCNVLESIGLSANIRQIGAGAFAGTQARILLDSGNPYYCMEGGVLYNADMTVLHTYPYYLRDTEFTVPDSVTEIEALAFYGATDLVSVTLPQGLTYIGNRAFIYCESLPSITLPEGLDTIGWLAFAGCSALKKVVIPASVTVIEDNAFLLDDSVVIYAPAGCLAESYAAENDIPFRAQ